jgi:hypothetical protein
MTKKAKQVQAGALPPHNVKDLPAPPPFTFKNVLTVIGPGAILLGTSIGSGEWLLGPATIVQYGAALLWITTVAIILQVFLNVEFVRYTMYTGEPIITGFMRTKPGPKFWGWVYSLFIFAQYLWPGWAAAAASTLFAAFMGRIPGAGDRPLMLMFGYLTFFLCVVVVIFGGKIERTLEYASWFMVAWIFIFLIFVNVVFVPLKFSLGTASGFLKFGVLPTGANWLLLGAFAAYSGAGGMGNCFISNWMRDKGYGMGSTVGFIPGAVGGASVKLSHVGNVFEINDKNLSKWRTWMKYLAVDQYGIWGIGCFLGMYLCVNLAAAVVPAGTKMTGLATGAYQAKYLMDHTGYQIFWFLTLLNGFWVLFSTQLGNLDGIVRLTTDTLWSGSEKVRKWRGGDVRTIYYFILAMYVIWGCLAMGLAQPLVLIMIGANIASFIFAFTGIHVIIVNRKILPKEVRAPLWREVVVILCSVFYAVFFVVSMGKVFHIF